MRNATITPVNASPAINPAVRRSPVLIIFSFGLTSVCLIANSHSLISSSSALPYFFAMNPFVMCLTIPPPNMGITKVNGKYIPIATGSTGISISISTNARTAPAITNGHTICPPKTPSTIPAIRNACGAGKFVLPI